MKLKLLLAFIILSGLSFCLSKKKHFKAPTNKDAPAHAEGHKNHKHRKPVETIKFGPPARTVNKAINSLGEHVIKDVVLHDFPFKIERCDQILLFAATYINDEDDYRVRKEGYVAITAHYTNLFADKDGQKLIQQNISSLSRDEPHHLKGARGCIRIAGANDQKNLNICTMSKGFATNLLTVYQDFARCRLGDNLQPISAEVLNQLMKLCGISRVTLTGSSANAAMNKLEAEIKKRNSDTMKSSMNRALGRPNEEMSEEQKKKLLKKFLKKKKELPPQYFIPSAVNNRWEENRARYVQYSKIHVPGARR